MSDGTLQSIEQLLSLVIADTELTDAQKVDFLMATCRRLLESLGAERRVCVAAEQTIDILNDYMANKVTGGVAIAALAWYDTAKKARQRV